MYYDDLATIDAIIDQYADDTPSTDGIDVELEVYADVEHIELVA